MFITADLHTHSSFSDGKLSIKELIDYYGLRGVNAIAITDHAHDRFDFVNEENFNEYLSEIKKQGEYAIAKYGMLVIPGLEITSDLQGFHIICLPIKRYISPALRMEVVLKKIKDDSCFSVACHPNRVNTEYPTTRLWQEREHGNKLVGAWELYSGKLTFNSIEFKKNWPFVAGSDFHEPEKHDLTWRMQVETKDFSLDGIIAGIKNRSIKPFIGFPI